MAASIRIDLATEADDAELRRLVRENAMPGEISVAFHREPSFFRAIAVEGDTQQVIVGRDGTEAARIRGVATRSTRALYVNGRPARLGYISGLRVDPGIRQSLWLARGYQKLRALHESDPVPLYVSTIIEDNAAAREILTSARAGLPAYRDLGRLRTFSIHLLGRARRARVSGVTVEPARPEHLPAILELLARHNAARQLAPVWSAEDFAADSPRLAGLGVSDFLLATRGGRVVGCVGRWDQSGIKQTVVVGYHGKMRWVRPLYAVAGRLMGFAPLPEAGRPFRYFYAALSAVDERESDAAAIYRLLLSETFDRALGQGYGFFMTGRHERDPLAAVIEESFRFTPYDARLYAVYWPDGCVAADALDERSPFLEVAVL